jgi:hypothetical protein
VVGNCNRFGICSALVTTHVRSRLNRWGASCLRLTMPRRFTTSCLSGKHILTAGTKGLDLGRSRPVSSFGKSRHNQGLISLAQAAFRHDPICSGQATASYDKLWQAQCRSATAQAAYSLLTFHPLITDLISLSQWKSSASNNCI